MKPTYLLVLMTLICGQLFAQFNPAMDITSYQVSFWKVTTGAAVDTAYTGEEVEIVFTAPSGLVEYDQQPNVAGFDTAGAVKTNLNILNANVSYTTSGGDIFGEVSAEIQLDLGLYVWAIRASNDAGWSKYSDPRRVLVMQKLSPPDRPITIKIVTRVN